MKYRNISLLFLFLTSSSTFSQEVTNENIYLEPDEFTKVLLNETDEYNHLRIIGLASKYEVEAGTSVPLDIATNINTGAFTERVFNEREKLGKSTYFFFSFVNSMVRNLGVENGTRVVARALKLFPDESSNLINFSDTITNEFISEKSSYRKTSCEIFLKTGDTFSALTGIQDANEYLNNFQIDYYVEQYNNLFSEFSPNVSLILRNSIATFSEGLSGVQFNEMELLNTDVSGLHQAYVQYCNRLI